MVQKRSDRVITRTKNLKKRSDNIIKKSSHVATAKDPFTYIWRLAKGEEVKLTRQTMLKHQDHAQGSALVYESPKNRQAKLREYNLHGWHIDPRYNAREYFLLVHGSKKPILVYKGTTNLDDYIADAAIVSGTFHYSDHFKKMKDIAKKIQQQYGSFDVTGHSLGGSTAFYVGNDLGMNSVAFNPGHGSFKYHTTDNPQTEGTNTIYLIPSDWLSTTAQMENSSKTQVIVGEQVSGKPHDIENFSIPVFPTFY